METFNLNSKINNAAKWSTITEIVAKLINPITSMILARLLAPEVFGIVASISMIISFAELFADAGFQKFLIQRDFKNVNEQHQYTSVAFWTNLMLSVAIWGGISYFSEPLAALLGSPGLGLAVTIASLQIIVIAFSSVQVAVYRRNFNFRTLFVVRVVSIFVPFIITIPLAILELGYWALIIGTLCGELSKAAIMTIKSDWRPQWYYDFKILKSMISFSMWTLLESMFIWFTAWIDIFVISLALSPYFLGIYKTSTTLVQALMSLVISAFVPVLFSALSRLQNDHLAFKEMFYKFQRYIAYFVLPFGSIVYIFSETITLIMLGNKWIDASNVIGIWALTTGIIIAIANLNSEVYRAKGNPKLSIFSQLIHLCFLIPTCLISVKYGFWVLVFSRAIIRFQAAITGFLLMKYFMDFPFINTVKNLAKPFFCTAITGGLAVLLKLFSDSLIWDLISIGIVGLFYVSILTLVARQDLSDIINIFR